jgi:hypothetical protein
VTARSAKVTAIPKKSGCDEFNCLRDTNDPLLYSSLLFLASGREGWRCELRSQLRFIRKPALISPLFFSLKREGRKFVYDRFQSPSHIGFFNVCRMGFEQRPKNAIEMAESL